MVTFDPLVHTKEYLLLHPEIAEILCVNCDQFATSELASDLDFLTIQSQKYSYTDPFDEEIKLNYGQLLAKHNKSWLSNPTSQNLETLMLKDTSGRSIAQELAETYQDWFISALDGHLDWLKIHDGSNETVGFMLAKSNPDFLKYVLNDQSKFDALMVHQSFGYHKTLAQYVVDERPELLTIEVLKNQNFLLLPAVSHIQSNSGVSKNHHLLVHEIAAKFPDWIFSKLATSKQLLSLKDSRGNSVAHIIAKRTDEQWLNSNWLKSSPILDKDISEMANKEGFTVLHQLAISANNNFVSSIKLTPEQLQLRYTSANMFYEKSNVSVAHELAQHSEYWVLNSPHAFTKEILTATSTFRDKSKMLRYEIPVAELLKGLKPVEAILRVIATGAAFKIGNMTLDESLVETVYTDGISLAQNEVEPNVKFKVIIALHATLHYFNKYVERENKVSAIYSTTLINQIIEAYNSCTTLIEGMIDSKIITEEPSFFSDINTEPSMAMVLRHFAKSNMESIDIYDYESEPTAPNEVNPSMTY
jgi:hypothetical protein